VINTLPKVDVRELAEALKNMPIRARGGAERVSKRIDQAREELKEVVSKVWKRVLAKARWRSPLLVMDEAHHLKNPGTSLARQVQSTESRRDLKTGDGALARKFERMLFLTATPFQLGHHELVRVLERFGDVRWDAAALGEYVDFQDRMKALQESLTESQRMAIALQRCWSRLLPEEGPQGADPDEWWESLQQKPPDSLRPRQRALVERFRQAEQNCRKAESELRPWLIRHNKGECWPGSDIPRRRRVEGGKVLGNSNRGEGIEVPPTQLLPFFLAARCAVSLGQDLLDEALCSSFEAFRYTRRHRKLERDKTDNEPTNDERARLEKRRKELARLSRAQWYLQQFDTTLQELTGKMHPKIHATVKRAVDLWEYGEKVLVFAFYRQTCRALRVHISREIEQRMDTLARRRFAGAGRPRENEQIERALQSIQRRYFDDTRSPGRKALDRALGTILEKAFQSAHIPAEEQAQWRSRLMEVMRRFLRVETTLVRCFPIHQYDTKEPHLAVRSMLDTKDASGVSWRAKFGGFIDFLLNRCSDKEREYYLQAAGEINTGKMRVKLEESNSGDGAGTPHRRVLSNVQEATGNTERNRRSRLMRAFNTPFFPDILVCSQVMGEGVDLQRYCCHVIHHEPRPGLESQHHRTAHRAYRPAWLQGRAETPDLCVPAIHFRRCR